MKESKITFETAKLAKEKGFELLTEKMYREDGVLGNSDFSTSPIFRAPTQSFLQKWLREVHDIDVIINTYRSQDNKWYKFFISEKSKDILKSDDYKSYEDALEVGLQEALKLIEIAKNEKNISDIS